MIKENWVWQWYNVIDEQGRYCGLKAVPQNASNHRTGQWDTHTFSYLYCRAIEKDFRDDQEERFGLELLVDDGEER